MAKYLLLAMNGPTSGEGDEAEYNKWYDEIHLPDLLAIEGVKSARRYKTVSSNRVGFPYVAAYEVETDDTQAFFAKMSSEPRPFTPAFDRSVSGMIFAELINDGSGPTGQE